MADSVMMSIKIPKELKEKIEKEAEKLGMSTSAFIRMTMIKAVESKDD